MTPSRRKNRAKSLSRQNRQHNSNSVGALNVDIELLVQSTQSFASIISQRKSSGLERFHGWLWKKSGRFAKWKNQHFVLDGALLSYFDTFSASQFVADSTLMPLRGDAFLSGSHDSTPTGVLRVAHVERSVKSRIAFKVYAVSGTVIDLRAKNDAVCAQWVQRLLDASMFAKRQETIMPSLKKGQCSGILGLSDLDMDVPSNLVDKNGWLEIGNPKSTRERFCVLQGKMITYYESEDPWAVPLSRAYIDDVELNDREKQIQLQTSEGRSDKKMIYIRAKSVEDLHSWRDALHQAAVR